MVLLPLGYCIDSTEVTQAQYKAWLDTPGSSSPDQPEECSWNTSVTPTCNWNPEAKPNYPVVCIDWCDAYAYCKAVGKRLCGRIEGGTTPFDEYDNAAESQWYAACSSGGENLYPYGRYDSDACNGWDYGAGAAVEVGLTTCQAPAGSGYEGVFDMSGNVWEWEDSCEYNALGQSDYCRLRGGTFHDGGAFGEYLECGHGASNSRTVTYDYVGFRCCAP